jgi:hypothetical protein
MGTKLYLREYARLATEQQGFEPQAAAEPGLVDQVIDFTSGATQSAAFSGQTRFVRMWCDVQCTFQFGANPTAVVNTNVPMAAAQPEYFGVVSGNKVSVIAGP